MYPAKKHTITTCPLEKRGQVASVSDENPGIVWFAELCRSNQVRFEGLIRNAERVRDMEMAAFFRRADAVGQTLASRHKRPDPPSVRCALA
jgi:hypothetical protein